jgi:hypothetical protein
MWKLYRSRWKCQGDAPGFHVGGVSAPTIPELQEALAKRDDRWKYGIPISTHSQGASPCPMTRKSKS